MRADLARAAVAAATLLLAPGVAEAQAFLLWGVQAEKLEQRWRNAGAVTAWEADAFVGTDELKLVFRSEGEYERTGRTFEKLETQFRLQAPVSDFFDAVAGVRLDTPHGGPDRVHGVVGLKGLAPQWFEIDADLYLSDRPAFRVEIEYEGAITNRLAFIPSVELELPLRDDDALRRRAFGPVVEVGARLAYDLVDRLVSPYVGVHYERNLGGTAARTIAAGEERGAFYLLAGTKIMF